jgi:spore coat protein A, manganese oxidase
MKIKFIKMCLVASICLISLPDVNAFFYKVDNVTGKNLLPGYTTGGGGEGGLTPFQNSFRYIQPAPYTTDTAGLHNYTITFTQFYQGVHTQLPAPTMFWGYGDNTSQVNAVTIGKAVIENIGQPFRITYINNLPPMHIFDPFLPEVPGTDGFMPASRGVAHFHGLPNTEEADGLPMQWLNPGDSKELYYPNPTDRTVFSFYHDHAMMTTRLNVYAGLAGGWIMQNPDDLIRYTLPAGINIYDIPMVIQDRSFYTDGSLNYNLPGFNYDYPMVNGVVSPYLEVEPRRYIFRLLNGSQSSIFGIGFTTDDKFTDLTNVPFKVIGSDGGFLDATAIMQAKFLPMAPGEKYWIAVDFTGYDQQNIIMTNQDPTGIFPGVTAYQNTMGSYFGDFTGQFTVTNTIMQFRVIKPLQGSDTSIIPATFTPTSTSAAQLVAQATYTRDIIIDGGVLNGGGFMTHDAPPIINLQPFPGDNNTPLMIMPINYRRFADPVTEMPLLNSTEIWNFINLGAEIHPFHTHLVFFRVLDRRPFNAARYAADRLAKVFMPIEMYIAPNAPIYPAQPWEQGLKETVQCPQNYITRVAMVWGPYAENYMYHCHILDHEEFEMMRPISVLPESTYFYELTRKYDHGKTFTSDFVH